jgi:hypothetical protein
MDSWQTGSYHALPVKGINVAPAKQFTRASPREPNSMPH